MPETMSFTSVWLPKEIAMPNTEAPAISGVMLTPNDSSAIITATMVIRTAPVARRSGIMVLMREAGGAVVLARHVGIGRVLEHLPHDVGHEQREARRAR